MKQTREPKNIFSSIHNERQHHTPEPPPKTLLVPHEANAWPIPTRDNIYFNVTRNTSCLFAINNERDYPPTPPQGSYQRASHYIVQYYAATT